MSDTTPRGTPDPYGQPPNPYGQPPNPYGQPPNPYGQAPAPQNPYGQQVGGENPYGQPSASQPVGNPYAAQQPGPPAGPLGDGLDMYGRPLGSDERPGGVTAAGWITIIVSGLMGLLFGFLTLAMVVAKDQVLREIDKAIQDQGASAQDFSAESAFGVVVAILLVLVAWCVIACVLAVFAMRRSNAARIMLVISAVVAGLGSLLGIGSVVTAVPLLACLAVVILLFVGGAGDWFARRRRF